MPGRRLPERAAFVVAVLWPLPFLAVAVWSVAPLIVLLPLVITSALALSAPRRAAL